MVNSSPGSSIILVHMTILSMVRGKYKAEYHYNITYQSSDQLTHLQHTRKHLDWYKRKIKL